MPLNQRAWSSAEVEFLCAAYQHRSAADIAIDLGRSRKAVQAKVDVLRLSKGMDFSPYATATPPPKPARVEHIKCNLPGINGITRHRLL